MRTLPFMKMHGLGNDFVIVDHVGGALSAPAMEIDTDLARKLCDRRFGVGADQIMWLRRPHAPAQADIRMEILNADGSVAEMCGNGIRAVALYLHDHGPERGKSAYRIETLAGLKIVYLVDRDGKRQVRVDMGPPQLGRQAQEGEPIEVEAGGSGETLKFHEVGMGNPHAVLFVDRLKDVPADRLGPALEHHARFPKRTNVEFVEPVGPRDGSGRASAVRVVVWERGAGLTLACGTGACASAVASILTGRAASPVKVELPGGVLEIEWAGDGEPVYMTGPAEEVFRGELFI